MKHGTAFPPTIKQTHLPSLLRRASLLFAGSLLLCVLLGDISLSVQAVHPTPSVQSSYQSQIQGTPTVDPTVTALQKEKLVHDTDWWWTNGVTLLTSLVSTVALLGGGLFAFVRWRREQGETEIHRLEDRQAEREKRDEEQKHWLEDRQAEREKRDEEQKRWLEDRQAEREKRTEERFQSVVEGLGSNVQATQVGAAITLRTFLRPGYEQFYSQAFDLAVAHLRLRSLNPDEAEPLDSLSQALITIFGESFPLARNHQPQAIRQLDAAHIHLDNAYLAEADLRQIWIPQASLRQATLSEAKLSGATLNHADLSGSILSKADLKSAKLIRVKLCRSDLCGADLSGAILFAADLSDATRNGTILSGADLSRAKLSEAILSGAKLSGATLSGADLIRTDLSYTYLSGTDLSGATLSGAILSGAILSKADLSDADLSDVDLSYADLSDADLSYADLSSVKSLTKTNLQRAKGLTQEELETYKAKGAII